MSFGKGLKTFRGRTRNRYNQNKEHDNGIRYVDRDCFNLSFIVLFAILSVLSCKDIELTSTSVLPDNEPRIHELVVNFGG